MQTLFGQRFKQEAAADLLEQAARSSDLGRIDVVFYLALPTKKAALQIANHEVHDEILIDAILSRYDFRPGELANALLLSVSCENTVMLRELLKRGACPFDQDAAPIVYAIHQGDDERLKIILDETKTKPTYNSVIARAINETMRHDKPKALDLLLTKYPGCLPFATKWTGEVAFQSQIELLEVLHAHGAAQLTPTPEMLKHAVRSNNPEVLDYLRKQGSNLGFSDNLPLREGLNVGCLVTALHLITEGFFCDVSLPEEGSDILPSPTSPRYFFPALARSIIDNTQSPHDCKAWFDLKGVRYPRHLKSDAFQKRKGEVHNPLTLCLLGAALVADQTTERIGRFHRYEAFQHLFTELASGDLERIETTTGLSYRKYHQELTPKLQKSYHIRDTIDEVVEAYSFPKALVAAPMLLRRMQVAFDLHQLNDKLLGDAQLDAIREIAGGKSTLDLLALSARWYKPDGRVPDDLRPYGIVGTWTPLFEPAQLQGGFSVQCLSTARELREEGDYLQHCVATYTSRCVAGAAHIVSLRKDGVPVATLEVAAKKEERDTKVDLAVLQFYGPKNSAPPPAAQAAWLEALSLMLTGEIPLATNYGGSAPAVTVLERKIGYPIEEAERYQREIREHYTKTVALERRGMRIPLLGPPEAIAD